MVIWSHAQSVNFLFSIQKLLLVLPEFSAALFGQLIKNRPFCPQKQQLVGTGSVHISRKTSHCPLEGGP